MATVLVHVIVSLAGICGLVLSSVLLDIDHSGSWFCKTKFIIHDYNENGKECQETVHRGFLHYRWVMMSLFAFSACFAIGIFLHMVLDFVKFFGFK